MFFWLPTFHCVLIRSKKYSRPHEFGTLVSNIIKHKEGFDTLKIFTDKSSQPVKHLKQPMQSNVTQSAQVRSKSNSGLNKSIQNMTPIIGRSDGTTGKEEESFLHKL